jgi:hypothetical protein
VGLAARLHPGKVRQGAGAASRWCRTLLLHQSSSPRRRGSSTPWPIDSITAVSGILDHPLSRVMTVKGMCKHSYAFPRRDAPGACGSFTLSKERGRRESRAPIAPAVVHKKRTSRPQGNRIIRLSPHDGLRLIRDHPGDRAFLPPSPRGLTMHRDPGWAGGISTGLDASVGASGPHDFAVRACPAKVLAGPRAIRPVSSKTVLKRRSSAHRSIAHGVQSAPRSLARPTLSRPSHPTARS